MLFLIFEKVLSNECNNVNSQRSIFGSCESISNHRRYLDSVFPLHPWPVPKIITDVCGPGNSRVPECVSVRPWVITASGLSDEIRQQSIRCSRNKIYMWWWSYTVVLHCGAKRQIAWALPSTTQPFTITRETNQRRGTGLSLAILPSFYNAVVRYNLVVLFI